MTIRVAARYARAKSDNTAMVGDSAASRGPLAGLPLGGDGSELSSLVRVHDWSQTPLGSIRDWPQSLRTAVSIMLTSRYAMWMGWGKDLTFLYNDAYRPTLGLKHPWALGSAASKVWAEIWRDIGPRIQAVLTTGKATYDEGLLLFLERSGFPEETYHTFSYSPLHQDNGELCGMLCVVTEETDRVISERRMTTLRFLSAALAVSNSEAEVLRAVEQQLGRNKLDLPFTIVYLFMADGSARLAGATGVAHDIQTIAPAIIEAGANFPWPASDMHHGVKTKAVDDVGQRAGSRPLSTGGWDKAPNQALVVAIRQQAHERPAGFLVVGLNPYRRLDAEYTGFVELIAGQLAAALANARAYDGERRRPEALAEVDRAKTVFFSNVSHEFRTPLTLMLGPLEDLLAKPKGAVSQEDHEALQLIYRSGLRLQRLVNTLLDFSRIEAGRAQARYEPTDLATLTAGFCSSFRSAMERAGLLFVVDCHPLSEPVFVDREMWEKVVLNLLSNAFKYTLHGSVRVELSESAGKTELMVTDTGIGIPAEEVPHLFERFHRVPGARGRTHEGTGIGLALVQELVRLHGGSVSVTSELGSGSRFTVALPFGFSHLPEGKVGAEPGLSSTAPQSGAYVAEALRWLSESPTAAAAEIESEQIAHKQHESPGRRSRVLLADDNADMRDYLGRLLGVRHTVAAVSNGEEALAAALADPPDLVLTDVMMPGLDGFGLLRELRAREKTKTLPILLLSARAGEESRVEGLDAGADDYIVKPFSARELLARVDAHLSLAKMRSQADQARRLSEVRLGLALEAPGMLSWEWNPENDKISSSGDMHSIFGVKLESSADGLRCLHPDDVSAHQAKLEQVGQDGGYYHSEFRIRRADTGATAWLEERATGLVDDDGRVRRVLGVVADVTERKVAEEELRRKNDELTKANQELEEFAYVASHDLQEPLRMVNIYSQLLLRREGLRSDEVAGQYAAFVHKSVARMEELISDLLVYSRVIHSEHEGRQSADLNNCLSEALSVLQVPTEETGAVFACEPLPTVAREERQLALVFQNLLSNALKYRREGVTPKIEIWAESRDGQALVNVRDNGIGFQPAHAERIFGLFKRLHKEAYPGTGLGLAICKRILQRYDGHIWGTSEGEGCGAVFTFKLPLTRL